MPQKCGATEVWRVKNYSEVASKILYFAIFR